MSGAAVPSPPRRITRPLGLPALETRLLPWVAAGKACAVRWAFRIRVESEGFEPHKFAAGPLIVVANHRSVLDAVLVRVALPPGEGRRTVTIGARDFLAPAETDRGLRRAGRALLCAYLVRAYRICLIGRGDDMGDGVPLISRAVECGWNVVLFPEGTRARTPCMGRFRAGVAHIARETGSAVLPVWISGSSDLLPVGATWLRSGVATLRAGEPMRMGPEERNAHFLERMRARMLALAGDDTTQ